jgi:chromate reductase
MSNTAETKVAVIVGSLRKNSVNRQIAKALAELAPAELRLEIVEIGHLPLYNQDLDDEGRAPEAWTAFRNELKDADAVLFVVPEYNRSIPGSVKNAIDVGSRPWGQSVWDGKPAAIVSTSPGALGGFGANHHLRQALLFFNMPILQQPEAYIGNTGALFEDGKLANDSTREFFRTFIKAFATLIATFTAKKQAAKAA